MGSIVAVTAMTIRHAISGPPSHHAGVREKSCRVRRIELIIVQTEIYCDVAITKPVPTEAVPQSVVARATMAAAESC